MRIAGAAAGGFLSLGLSLQIALVALHWTHGFGNARYDGRPSGASFDVEGRHFGRESSHRRLWVDEVLLARVVAPWLLFELGAVR
ncbi:hypothetical protein M758_8G076700 [Ceratodon purpureus]|uniref:Secreted protein n=1 Tax=Ceratodon purpureus TaxID=3225 RepID=A0A8T0H113_CERPU|nr:hypothetical protein KC19_8G081800 [Ceratodon purpureus]KAG0608086.1 hypothetical protein M758_8G076700 [Ceratodon purpureus]